MALFNRSGRTQTVNQFIVHRGRSAIGAYQDVLNENVDLATEAGTSRQAARVALEEGLQQINSDLAAAKIESLPVSFLDEQGLTIGRRVTGKQVNSTTSMFVVSNRSLSRARLRGNYNCVSPSSIDWLREA